MTHAIDLSELSELIRSRRSNLLVDKDRPLPVELIRELCELALWAPNHKRTWPARFALFTGDGRARLGEAFADDLAELASHDRTTTDPARVDKARTKYLRAPAVLLIGSAAHHDQSLQVENLHTVAAGIQNLLLGATAAGLASFWATPALHDSQRARRVAGFEPDVHLMAVVYLGWPTRPLTTPERPRLKLMLVGD